jgi:hypothetical protein
VSTDLGAIHPSIAPAVHLLDQTKTRFKGIAKQGEDFTQFASLIDTWMLSKGGFFARTHLSFMFMISIFCIFSLVLLALENQARSILAIVVASGIAYLYFYLFENNQPTRCRSSEMSFFFQRLLPNLGADFYFPERASRTLQPVDKPSMEVRILDAEDEIAKVLILSHRFLRYIPEVIFVSCFTISIGWIIGTF